MNPASDSDWKDLMFRTHADAFCDILDHKSLVNNLGDLIAHYAAEGESRRAILDLGCGNGRLLPLLSRLGSVVVGIDYSGELLSRASAKARLLPNTVLVRGDFRNLEDIFPARHFQIILRAYTSLGYFDYSTEADILKACHKISDDGALLIVDTFNAEWLAECGEFTRTTTLAAFTFRENYKWDSIRRSLDCVWTYDRGEENQVVINFWLEGYDRNRVERLLIASGWGKIEFFSDFDKRKRFCDSKSHERIVAVARRSESQSIC